MEKSDAIFFGSGLATVLCAALCAQHGMKIVYIPEEDKNYSVGYGPQNEAFPVCGCYFDMRGGVMEKVLNELSVTDDVKYTVPEKLYDICIGDNRFEIPGNWGDYQNYLISRFSNSEKAITEYFKTIKLLSDEWKTVIMSNTNPPLRQIANTIKYRKYTYEAYINELFDDDLLKGVISANLPYSKISLVTMAGYIMQTFESVLLEGGYKKLKDVLVRKIQSNGGTVIQKNSITHISDFSGTEKMYIAELDNGIKISTDYLIFHGDKFSFHRRFRKQLGEIDDSAMRSSLIMVNVTNQNHKKCCSDSLLYYPNADINKYYCCLENGNIQKGDPAFFIHFPMRESISSVQIEIPVPSINDGDSLKRVVTDVLVICGKIMPEFFNGQIEILILSIGERENVMNLYRAIDSTWAFSPEQMNVNPLTAKCENGIYTLGSWGKAFIAAAKIVSKNILRDKKRVNNA